MARLRHRLHAAAGNFSIFRRTSEVPLFRVEKHLKGSNKQGAYAVVGLGGVLIKRGHDLEAGIEIQNQKVKLTIV